MGLPVCISPHVFCSQPEYTYTDGKVTTGNIAKALDDFFKADPQKKKKYYQELTFTPQIIIEPKLEKKGFFKSLFSK